MPGKAKYSKKDLLDLLTGASVLNCFAEGASNAMNGPDADTLFIYLKRMKREKLLELFDQQVERSMNFLSRKGLLSKPVPVAIDWFDWMYYGSSEDEMVTGTIRKNGSNYAFQFMTASIIADGRRIVLAVLPISSRKLIGSLAISIIRKLRCNGLELAYLAFDGGFFCNELLSFLETSRIKYIMRLPSTSQTRRKRLWHGRRFRYTTNNRKLREDQQVSFDVVVSFDPEKDFTYLFATNMLYDAERLLCRFKSRFGIETSYRINNQFLPKTTSKNYTVRLFYYLFACTLQNCWVLCKREVNVSVLEIRMVLLKVFLANVFRNGNLGFT